MIERSGIKSDTDSRPTPDTHHQEHTGITTRRRTTTVTVPDILKATTLEEKTEHQSPG